MRTKLGKMYNELAESFKQELHAAFQAKYGVALETEFNIFSMQLISKLPDGQDFTPEQHAFVGGYSEGYNKAMALVMIRDGKDEYEREMRLQAREAKAAA
jgi:hypothetical protein